MISPVKELACRIAGPLRSTMLYRRYIEGGGSRNDFATDLTYVIEELDHVSKTEKGEPYVRYSDQT